MMLWHSVSLEWYPVFSNWQAWLPIPKARTFIYIPFYGISFQCFQERPLLDHRSYCQASVRFKVHKFLLSSNFYYSYQAKKHQLSSCSNTTNSCGNCKYSCNQEIKNTERTDCKKIFLIIATSITKGLEMILGNESS